VIALALMLSAPAATPQAYDSVSDVARVFAAVLKDHLYGDTPETLSRKAIDGMLKALDPWSRRVPKSKAPTRGQAFICLRDRGVLRLTIKRFNGDGRQWLKVCPGLNQNLPVLIDLRDNPGGSVADALGLADLFASDIDLLIEERRFGEPVRHRANAQKANYSSLVILVNSKTASAAEVIAAALQRVDRVKVLGDRTMGKVTVQTAVYLSSDDVVLITTGKLRLPDGSVLEGKGLTTDGPQPPSPSAFTCRQAGRRWTSAGCADADKQDIGQSP